MSRRDRGRLAATLAPGPKARREPGPPGAAIGPAQVAGDAGLGLPPGPPGPAATPAGAVGAAGPVEGSARVDPCLAGAASPARPARTVGEALAEARAAGVERLDALALLGALLAQPRSWLIAHPEAEMGAVAPRWAAGLARRAAGEPLAYLLGEKAFHGLVLAVGPAVLVPRPDTETLVDWALEHLPPGAAWRVADLGTGSGAIALAVAAARPAARLVAVDASPEALAVAIGNARRLGLDRDPEPWASGAPQAAAGRRPRFEARRGDWWAPLAGERFELVLSNPPYIAEGDPHLAALRHEPALALASGPDGLDAIRRVVAGAAAHLQPGGWLLLEHGWDQAGPVAELLRGAGFEAVAHRRDLAGHLRCSGGRRPAVA